MASLSIVTVKNVRGGMERDVVKLNLEDCSIGLGFVTTATKEILATSGKKKYTNVAVRWNRVSKYLTEIGDTLMWCKQYNPKQFTEAMQADYDELVESDFRPEYISESVFYMLVNKANNDVARAFQLLVAYEICPAIRKKGFYGSLTREDLMGRMRRMKISAEEYEEFLTGIPAYKKPMPVKMYNRTIKEWEENGERIYTVDDLPAAMRENMDLLESYIYKINRKSKNYHMIAYRPGAIKFSFGGLEKILDYGIRNKIIKRREYMEALGIPAGIK